MAKPRPDLAIYALELAKRQKKAVIKDLREVNRVLKKVRENESKVVFTKIGEKEELCVLGVSDALYHHDDRSVADEMISKDRKSCTNVLEIRSDKEGMSFTKGCRDKSITKING